MSNFKDLTGKTFERLTVIDRAEKGKSPNARWNCICKCGNKSIVIGSALINGKIKSCGCYNRDRINKHGLTGTRIHKLWLGMRDRCNNPNNQRYYRYKGLCCSCVNDFITFYNHMINLPYSGDLTRSIDRIDNEGLYCICKNNLRWATPEMQSNNTRKYKTNKTGYAGVEKRNRPKPYQARVYFNKIKKTIGSYYTALEAHEARQAYIKEKFPEYYNPNL